MHKSMLSSVCGKQLQETPQEHMIHTFGKVWSKGVLEVAKSSVSISKTLRRVLSSMEAAPTSAFFRDGPCFSGSSVVIPNQSIKSSYSN